MKILLTLLLLSTYSFASDYFSKVEFDFNKDIDVIVSVTITSGEREPQIITFPNGVEGVEWVHYNYEFEIKDVLKGEFDDRRTLQIKYHTGNKYNSVGKNIAPSSNDVGRSEIPLNSYDVLLLYSINDGELHYSGFEPISRINEISAIIYPK